MHLATTVERPFDFVRARQHDMPPHISKHLTHYQEIMFRAGMSFEDISPSIASAFLMDYYRPGQVRISGEFLLLDVMREHETRDVRIDQCGSPTGLLVPAFLQGG